MAGGVLTGKYDAGGDRPRRRPRSTSRGSPPPARRGARCARSPRRSVSARPRWRSRFALANPAVASVLFGATSPAQIAENVTALEIDPAAVQRLLDL